MTKRITTLALAAAIGLLVPVTALASTVAGRVTSVRPTAIAVFDKEVITFALKGDTVFTKLIVAKPWQADTALTANALEVGRYVVVHADNGIANWVQVAVDRPPFTFGGFTAIDPRSTASAAFIAEAATPRAESAALRAAANASESKRPGSPGTAAHCDRIADRLEEAAGVKLGYAAPVANLGTAAPVLQAGDILSEKALTDLIANAKTPADHKKLAKHYTAVAAKYDADAANHVAEAKAYRKAPGASESKRPGSPDTAAHCDRLADLSRQSAAAARALTAYHDGMVK